jgi:hypothetical protein
MSRKPYRRFASLETEVVWAAVERLDIADQHSLLEALTQQLFVEPHLSTNGPTSREARAVLALREAVGLLGHSPSIKEFADLREQHPECSWPHPSRVRAWLGSNSWNAALERAGLKACATDAIIRERVGARFSEETLIRALQLSARELQVVPTFEQYISWARRPDAVAEHGLLPRSLVTFTRVFGSWHEACVAAGLRGSDVLTTREGVVRYAGHQYTRNEVLDGLRCAATELGCTPTVTEYKAVRERLQRNLTDRKQKSIPSVGSIRRFFGGDWSVACVAAGLTNPGEATSAAFDRDYMLRCVARALRRGYVGAVAYDHWRARMLQAATRGGLRVRIPAAASIKRRFGGWKAARAEARQFLERSK